MLNNRDGTNEKPRDRASTHSQGAMSDKGNGNSTTHLKDSRSRYDKGMELYKEGKVKVGSNGLFKVSGYYECDTERMTCTCPDYRTRKESCKHLFAAMLFVKNRGKEKIEHLEGNGKNQGNTSGTLKETGNISETGFDKPKEAPNKPTTLSEEIHGASNPVPLMAQGETGSTNGTTKPFDRQATITRLAVLNTAVELLKTHRTPLEPETVISVAAQLEKWALGGAA